MEKWQHPENHGIPYVKRMDSYPVQDVDDTISEVAPPAHSSSPAGRGNAGEASLHSRRRK